VRTLPPPPRLPPSLARAPILSWAPGREKSGLLCYNPCPAGWIGEGPSCWEPCPTGYSDVGWLCSQYADTYFKGWYNRGVGALPPADGTGCAASGKENVDGLCYTSCRTGYGAPPLLPYICRDVTPCRDGYADTGVGCRYALPRAVLPGCPSWQFSGGLPTVAHPNHAA
jgi:hypothetical protein